jgi:hypothetical protein
MRLRSIRLSLSAAAVAACAAGPALAQVPADAGEPRTWIQASVVASRWSTDIGSSFGFDPVIPYNTERDLGLRRTGTTAQLALGRRIGERWRILVDHEQTVRRGSTVLARDIESDDSRFVAGTRLDSRVSLASLQVLGGWAALQRPGLELGVLFGGRWLEVDAQLEGTGVNRSAFAPPAQAPKRADQEDSEAAPVLGVFVESQIGPSTWLSARAHAAKGGSWNARALAQWRLNRHLALGLGYTMTRFSVDSDICYIGCSRTFVDGTVHGPLATLQLSF